MCRKLTTMLVPALLAALLVAVAPPAATATADGVEMSDEQAGSYFLKSVCASNAAIDTFSHKVFRGRDSIPFTEVRRRFHELKRLIRPLANASYNFARDLTNAPGEWPSSVSGPVSKTTSQLLRAHRLYRDASYAATPLRLSTLWKKADQIPMPTATIRLRLDLPPPGKGC